MGRTIVVTCISSYHQQVGSLVISVLIFPLTLYTSGVSRPWPQTKGPSLLVSVSGYSTPLSWVSCEGLTDPQIPWSLSKGRSGSTYEHPVDSIERKVGYHLRAPEVERSVGPPNRQKRVTCKNGKYTRLL